MVDYYLDGKLSTTEKLYLILEERLKENGEELNYSQAALNAYASSPRADIDCLKLINLDNRSFLEAVYMIAFNFTPPLEYINEWDEKIKTLTQEEFQREFISSFVTCPAFGKEHVRLRNCLYIHECVFKKNKSKKQKRLRGILLQIYYLFKPIYLNLPAKMKSFLKTHFRKYVFE